MAFTRLSAFIGITLAALQVANAGLARPVLCPSGHITANSACCGMYRGETRFLPFTDARLSTFPHGR